MFFSRADSSQPGQWDWDMLFITGQDGDEPEVQLYWDKQ